jgi:nucleoside-diphosphate-sugar epimerase
MPPHNQYLITGGSGFVGLSLIDEIVGSGGSVVATSRDGKRPHGVDPSVTFVPWDIGSDLSYIEDVDCVIHCATPASAMLNSTFPDEMYRLNVEGATAVRRFAERRKRGRKLQILFTSSGAVYGDFFSNLSNFSEPSDFGTQRYGATSAYGRGKREAESILLRGSKEGLYDLRIARLFAFSGHYLPLDRHFAIGNFVRDAILEQEIVVRSDGQSIRSYMDQQDMARWLITTLTRGNESVPYHIGSERAITIRDLAFLVAERYHLLTGQECGVSIRGTYSPLDGVSRYVPETTATRRVLQVHENVSLEKSIDAMFKRALASRFTPR